MSIPLLQIALDNTTLSGALKSAKAVGNEVDIYRKRRWLFYKRIF